MGFGRLRAGRKVTVNGRTFVFIVRRIDRVIGFSISRREYKYERGEEQCEVFSWKAVVLMYGTSCSDYEKSVLFLLRIYYDSYINSYECSRAR